MKKGLKYVAGIIFIAILGFALSVYSYSEPQAGIYEATSIVNVNGMLSSNKAGNEVTLILLDKNADFNNATSGQIGYVDQTQIQQDGSYSFKFKFIGNIDDYKLLINQAGENVTKSVTRATSNEELFKITLNLSDEGSVAKAAVTINNLYDKESMAYKMVLAFYSADGKILAVKAGNSRAIGTDITEDELTQNVPEETDIIKAFIWDSTEKIIPLCTPVESKYIKTIKVLAIGNSFSEDSSKYLHDIAAVDNLNLEITNLYIGGCTLQTHWLNANNDYRSYDYQLNSTSTGTLVSIKEMLDKDDWDYITLQQASGSSGREQTYYPYIENLAKYIKKIEPKAEILIHQTWAYETGSTHAEFPNYNCDQLTMFNALKNAYNNASASVGLLTLDDGTDVSPNKAPIRIIPCGQAFQNARANYMFNSTYGDGKTVKLNRDGYHASYIYGRYLLGAVWYEVITGNEISANTFKPSSSMTDEAWNILKQAAHDAVVEYQR